MKSVLKRNGFSRKPLQSAKITKHKSSTREKIVWWALLWIFLIASYTLGWMGVWAKQVTNGMAYILSATIGTSMIADSETHNINILLVGYGGGNHDGGQLADTIMVASYNPKFHSVSLLSIPRDLIVLDDQGQKVKINSVLSRAYNNNGGDIRKAAQKLLTSAWKITGLTISYYAMIDFDGFIEVIDSIGGIDIYVPTHFLDRQYPVDRDGSYEIFELFEGMNHLSGPNTLKYARSRHSTSDFSRSKRQQQILEATLQKILSSDNFSVNKIKELYNSYTTIVKTNISIEELIGLAKHGTNLPTMYSFGYTSQCTDSIWRTMLMGCVLRDATGGILPTQSTGGNIEAYDITKLFANFVTKDPRYLSEDARITIYNASDKELTKTLPYGDSLASKTASKMRKYGLNVIGVANADNVSTGSFIEIYGTGSYEHTITIVKQFVDISAVIKIPDHTNTSGVWMSGGLYINLGNDYLEKVGQTPFDFYALD